MTLTLKSPQAGHQFCFSLENDNLYQNFFYKKLFKNLITLTADTRLVEVVVGDNSRLHNKQINTDIDDFVILSCYGPHISKDNCSFIVNALGLCSVGLRLNKDAVPSKAIT